MADQSPRLTPNDPSAASEWTDDQLRAAWRQGAHTPASSSFGDVQGPQPRAFQPRPAKKTGKTVVRQALFNLYGGLIYAVGITGFYGYLFLDFEQRWIRIGLVAMMLFNLLLAGMSLPLIAKFHHLRPDAPVLPYLHHLRDDLKSWWALQRWMTGGALPLAAATGFLMGGVIGSGDPDFVAFEDKWPLVFVLVGVSLAAIPLGLKLSDWLYQHSYAKDVQRVEAWIAALEDLGADANADGADDSVEAETDAPGPRNSSAPSAS